MNKNNASPKPSAGGYARWWHCLLARFGLARENAQSLRESFDEILEDYEDHVEMAPEERMLIENILKIGSKNAYDVMIPRADIIAVPLDIKHDQLVEIMLDHPHSRYPVFNDDLDHVEGMIHIKDVFQANMNKGRRTSLKRMLRAVLFVAPKMPVLDLLLEMRNEKRHMALVVDEYGGVDGLVTIEDLVEEIVGDIEDEYDIDGDVQPVPEADGSYKLQARIELELLEETIGSFLTEEEQQEDIDTLGGLIYHLCGRVPSRGEVIAHHPSGIEFTILKADPRRIRTVLLKQQDSAPQTASPKLDSPE